MTYHRDRPDALIAECAKLDPRTADELFFANGNSPEAQRARLICRTCPLILQCRAYADTHEALEYPAGHVAAGVWGGETVAERNARRENKTPHLALDRIALEDQSWTDGDAARAANAYRSGDRSEWAQEGRRVYQRRWKRARRQEAAA